jgi:hypothetical protein
MALSLSPPALAEEPAPEIENAVAPAPTPVSAEPASPGPATGPAPEPPHATYWRVALLPFLLVAYIRFFFRPDLQTAPWIPTALVLGVIAVQLWLLRGRPAVAAGTPATAAGRWVSPLLFTAVFTLFAARAAWHYEIFPAYLLGESGSTLTLADVFADAPPQDMGHVLKSYNLGLAPLFSVVPQAARTMETAKLFTIAVYGVMVAGFVLLLHHAVVRLRGEPIAALAVYAPLAVCGLTLVCTRRYKWHAVAFAGGIAVYAILLGIQEADAARRRARVAVGVALLAASIVLYHGTIVFVPVVVVMLLLEAWMGPPERRGERTRLAKALTAAVLLVVAFVLAKRDFSGFYERLTFEVDDPRPEAAVGPRLLRNWNNVFDAFFITDFSFPLSVAFIVGFVACLTSLRSSWLSRVHLGVFAGVGLPLLYTYAFTNPDETHFALAPILAVVAVGLVELTRPLAAGRARLLALVAALTLASIETSHYETAQLWRRLDAFPHPNDPAYRLTLALRDAQRLRRFHEPERVVFFLPAGVEPSEQDFKYRHLMQQRDYADVRDHVRPYRSAEELAVALRPLLHVEKHASRIRVYVDDELDVDALTRRVATPAYAHGVVQVVPYREVWKEYIPLRFVDFVRVR